VNRHRIEIEFDATFEAAQEIAEALDFAAWCEVESNGGDVVEFSMTPVVEEAHP
jgi:hypothetical protein